MKFVTDPDAGDVNVLKFTKKKVEKKSKDSSQRLVNEVRRKMETRARAGKLLKKGRALFLAYDQGMEHGPSDFNDKNVDPLYIIDIAKKGGYSGVIFQKGIAEKYREEIEGVSLIVKLNGKTNLVKGEPISRQLCTVDEAVKLGAVGVGYTIYLGSQHESKMMQEFEKIQREARSKGLMVIVWIYPRGKGVRGKSRRKLMAYCARVGLEIGADIIKIKYEGFLKDLKLAVENAGRTKIVIAGGSKKGEKELLKEVKEIIRAGCIGLAIGRNVWQAKEPLKVTKKIKKIIWSGK